MITNKFYISLIITLSMVILGGCTHLQIPSVGEKVAPTEKIIKEAPHHNKTQFSRFDLASSNLAGDFVIRRGDQLRVMIWGYPGLEHITEVQPNGHITLPLAGEVLAADLTLPELEKSITEHLEKYTKPSDLLLRPGDSVTLAVWQNPDLIHKAIVEPAGTITFPLVGTIKAAGRPLDKISKEVQGKIRHYIRDARVTLLPEFLNRRTLQDFHVSVLTHNVQKRKIAILGAVGLQGIQKFSGSMRISDALAQSQLKDKIAALNSIVVIRNPEGEAPQYRRIRIADYFEGKAPDQNIYLQHEDIIIVPKTTIAKVGEFVDLFFTRTMPVFQWWSSLNAAKVAEESSDSVRLINESLEKDLLNITP